MQDFKPRRNRFRSNSRDHRRNGDSNVKHMHRSNSGNNDVKRNFFNGNQGASKLFEKYKNLAQEAFTAGDKTLSENYYQHADHFQRVLSSRNIENSKKEESLVSDTNKSTEALKNDVQDKTKVSSASLNNEPSLEK